MRPFDILSLVAGVLLCAACGAPSGKTAAELEKGFLAPPQDAKPRVWWHWINANISEEGVKADLEWMDRVGVGGFHVFDANQRSPRIVDPVVYMSPEWKRIFRGAIRTADSLGMEAAIASSPGWSETGGPWVAPEEAMKKVVWSETTLKGGVPFKGVLPQPPSASGAFQDFESVEGVDIPYYRDIAVVAFRSDEVPMKDMAPRIAVSGGEASVEVLTDGHFSESSHVIYKDGKAWIEYSFENPLTVYAVEESGGGYSNVVSAVHRDEEYAYLEAGDDESSMRRVTGIRNAPGVNVAALSFAPVTARRFRLVFPEPYIGPGMNIGITLTPDLLELAKEFGVLNAPQNGVDVSEFRLLTVPRVDRYIEKAGWSVATTWNGSHEAVYPGISEVVDLSGRMTSDGTLEWTPGEGNWKVLRFGYSLTGKQNSPASPEATGLEVDKFNPAHVRKYINTYLDMYEEASGGLLGGRGIQYIMTDSWEAGTQNWTEEMPRYFHELRGYDLVRFLPALAGYIVDDSRTTDRFLWDWRKTMGELVAGNHYGVLSQELKKRGMGRYTETHEGARGFVGDGMEPKKGSDIPMAAMWTPTDGSLKEDRWDLQADNRESASVAHLYGQKYVAAESLTAMGMMNGSAWSWTPETLKPTADLELAGGINRFVMHSTVHQPSDDFMPGLSLGIFGHWFNRHETWAEQAGPWMTYLARSSYMLQQGLNVADILYFYGEDTNITSLFSGGLPAAIPEGYNFDFINPDGLENDITVKGGHIVAPSGATYAILALDPHAKLMTMKTLRKIEKLVQAGATVIGQKPERTPSLMDDPAEFETLASKLWDGAEGGKTYGKGSVYGVLDLGKALPQADVRFSGFMDGAETHFVHRSIDGVEIYWVNSRNATAQDAEVTFRVSGLKPELWDPVSGHIQDLSFKVENGTTTVPIHFNAWDSYFVVFRHKADRSGWTAPGQRTEPLLALEGPWDVSFHGFGAPDQTAFEDLSLWNLSEDASIRYYAGTADYTKTFTVSGLSKDSAYVLDLGKVYNIASVKLNGKDLGILWRAPFRTDVSGVLREGENRLEIAVTSTWCNRLIGDTMPGEKKWTWTPMPFFLPYMSLKNAGLEGPVSIDKITSMP